jgi:hypothetical protein
MARDVILDYYERQCGIYFPEGAMLAEDGWLDNIDLAMDAQPTLVTAPSGGIPALLMTVVDPTLLKVLTAKNKAVDIFPEVRKGDWTDDVVMFPVIEYTGEVSTYGDYNNSGRVNANPNFPQRESYLYQTVVEYGDRELDRAGKAKIGWASEVRNSAATVLTKFQNLTYFKGVAGLQNYGIQTDPALSAPIAPAPKAWGGLSWFNGAYIAASPNEIYLDIEALFTQLVSQSGGNAEDELILALSPKSKSALTATNSFNTKVRELITENFPKIKIVDAVQYGILSTQNPQGIAAGELIQLIATDVENQDTGWCAFNEKMRAHPVIRGLSSLQQKMTQGTLGAVIRQPFAIAQMLGI